LNVAQDHADRERAYFDAKARARAAANYPPDTGGLLPPQ
jgi:hypothetical protein